MLRQKFILLLGSLVALLMVTAVTAIVLLHGVLNDLDALGSQAMEGTTLTLRLGADASQLHAEVNRRDSAAPALERVNAMLEEMRDHLALLAQTPAVQREAEALEALGRAKSIVDEVSGIVGSWAGKVQVDEAARADALAPLPRLRSELAALDAAVHQGMESARARVVWRFRLIVVGLALVFLVLINLSVLAISRIMGMVVRPVESLVEASRRLAAEDFAHRVRLERADEFGELGRSYNLLAEQLQANESRKLEVMHQVARTLNHEVNNAISIIELQLALLDRSASRNGASAGGTDQREHLSQIRSSLGRISRTISALTRIRRIVLTDYLAGVSMLDLERSTADEPVVGAAGMSKEGDAV